MPQNPNNKCGFAENGFLWVFEGFPRFSNPRSRSRRGVIGPGRLPLGPWLSTKSQMQFKVIGHCDSSQNLGIFRNLDSTGGKWYVAARMRNGRSQNRPGRIANPGRRVSASEGGPGEREWRLTALGERRKKMKM